MKLDDAIERYLKALKARNLSLVSIKVYRGRLKMLSKHTRGSAFNANKGNCIL